MAKILIEPAKTKLVLSQQSALENKLNKLSQEVDNVRGAVRYKIAGQQNIVQCLREAAEQISKESQSIQSMRSGLEQITARYEQTELENVGRLSAVQTSIQQARNSQSALAAEIEGSFEPQEFDWWDLIIQELANGVGPAGFIFTGGKELAEGNWGSAINELLSSIGEAAKTMIDKPRAEWAGELFGLTKITKENLPTFWGEMGDVSSFGNVVGTVANWGTALFGSLLDNLEEFGDDSWGGRFWAETGVETVIKVVEDAAITAGVAAVAVAAFGAAPAVAVGAAAVGVTMLVDWGLDNFVSWATNGSQTSWVEGLTDLVCDTGEKIIDAVGSAATVVWDATKEAVGAVADTVSEGWNNLKEGVFNFFSGCKWGGIFA